MLTDDQHNERRHEAGLRLGITLRRIRHQRCSSQEQIAFSAGVALPTYGALERGRTPSGDDANPTLDTLLRVFYALDIDASDLTATSRVPGEPAH